MFVSKLLRLSLLGWSMFTLGDGQDAPEFEQVFELSGYRAGLCGPTEQRYLHEWFVEMQNVARDTVKPSPPAYERMADSLSRNLAFSFLGTTMDRQDDESDLITQQTKDWFQEIDRFLHTPPGDDEKPLLWCGSSDMFWRRGKDLETRGDDGSTIAEILAQYVRLNIDEINKDYWVFTMMPTSSKDDKDGSTIYVVIPKRVLPGIRVNGMEQPFPDKSFPLFPDRAKMPPSACTHPTTTSWSFLGFQVMDGQFKLRKIVILCRPFKSDSINKALYDEEDPIGTRLDDVRPFWFEFYVCIIKMLFLNEAFNAPLFSPDIKSGLVGAQEGVSRYFNKKSQWLESKEFQARDAEQCLAIALYDRAEPVNPFDQRLAPKCPASLTWFSIATYLTVADKYEYDWSTGVKTLASHAGGQPEHEHASDRDPIKSGWSDDLPEGAINNPDVVA